jgi:biotin carboxyl carrier protein
MKVAITFRGREYDVELAETDGKWIATVDGEEISLKSNGSSFVAGNQVLDIAVSGTQAMLDGNAEPFHINHLAGVAGAFEPAGGKHGPVKPPMTGKLEQILVTDGQEVAQGDVLFVLEAMKMRNEIKAPIAGIVANISATVGDAVDSGNTILEIHAA